MRDEHLISRGAGVRSISLDDSIMSLFGCFSLSLLNTIHIIRENRDNSGTHT